MNKGAEFRFILKGTNSEVMAILKQMAQDEKEADIGSRTI